MLRSQLDHYFFKSSLKVKLDEVSGDFLSEPYFSFQLSSQCMLVNLCDYLMNVSFLYWAMNFLMAGMVSALFTVLSPPQNLEDIHGSVRMG